MTNPTDTNQASEDELRDAILTEFKQVYKLAGSGDYTENCTNVVMSIIRTEKLKLLAEVRERVIGEVPSKMNTDNWKYDRRVAELKLWQHQAIDQFEQNLLKELEEV